MSGKSDLFQSNAERLRALRAAIHEAVKRRNEDAEHRKVWQGACATFHASYDRLAFPGGLLNQMMRLKGGKCRSD